MATKHLRATQILGAELGAPYDPAVLDNDERWWSEREPWLREQGYKLRQRYKPNWKPSWKTNTSLNWADCEDSLLLPWGRTIMDATRISNGAFVVLKLIITESHPREIELLEHFSTEPRKSDPKNHCVPLYQVLYPLNERGWSILVTPLLKPFDEPRFQTFGECIAFFTQLFEGLQFIHKNDVAHRDCYAPNVMMDATPLYPTPYHPSAPHRRRDWSGNVSHFERTEKPVKYYFIDFGLARSYPSGHNAARELPILGADKSPPEHQGKRYNEQSDPFATDIYFVGNLIYNHFVKKAHGFEFMRELVLDMIREDPKSRPNIDEVLARFLKLRNRFSKSNLRSRVVFRDEGFSRLWRPWGHFIRTLGYLRKGVPPIPDVGTDLGL